MLGRVTVLAAEFSPVDAYLPLILLQASVFELKTEMKKVQSAVELVGDGVKEVHVDVKEGRDELKIMMEEVRSFQTTLATIGDQVRVFLGRRSLLGSLCMCGFATCCVETWHT